MKNPTDDFNANAVYSPRGRKTSRISAPRDLTPLHHPDGWRPHLSGGNANVGNELFLISRHSFGKVPARLVGRFTRRFRCSPHGSLIAGGKLRLHKIERPDPTKHHTNRFYLKPLMMTDNPGPNFAAIYFDDPTEIPGYDSGPDSVLATLAQWLMLGPDSAEELPYEIEPVKRWASVGYKK